MSKFVILGYAILLVFISAFSYAFVDVNLSYLSSLYTGVAINQRIVVTGIYIFIVLLLFGFYSLFYRAAIQEKNLKLIRNVVIVSMIILFFSYPAMLSYDIFNYIATAKVLFFYRENPYVIMPIEFIGDPLLNFTHAANKLALYGFSWILLTGIPFILGFGYFVLTLFNFKLLMAIFYSFAVYLIWKITRNASSAIFFALHPLVIIETLISSHNDIAMIVFILLSYICFQKKKPGLGLLFFIVSVFIKYASVFLLPITIYLLYSSIEKRKVNWERIFIWSGILMMIAFFLSHFREEIYPWYAQWFLVFGALVIGNKFFRLVCMAVSIGLLFRYIPFMLWGTHAGVTPFVKAAFTLIPPSLLLVISMIRKKIPAL